MAETGKVAAEQLIPLTGQRIAVSFRDLLPHVLLGAGAQTNCETERRVQHASHRAVGVELHDRTAG